MLAPGATALAILLVSGCDLGKIDLPVTRSKLVIHGVLTPTADTQSVLVERTLTGEFPAPRVGSYAYGGESAAVDGFEPVISDGGVPERAAVVQLIAPDGQTTNARELSSYSARGNGAGIYTFLVRGSTLVPGGRYQLRVVTRQQEVVTAETIIPEATAVRTPTVIDFNRTIDTLALTWPATPPAPAYQVRIESPFGAWSAVTDSAHLELSGELRRVDRNVPHAFIPGFRQTLTVSAVDANLYDYYRTSNNSFTGSGIISRVHGGLGVFGSLVTVARRTVRVSASVDEPIEGAFDLDTSNDPFRYAGFANALFMTLYVESNSARKGQPDAITGSYGSTAANQTGAAMGTLTGNKLSLVFLRTQTLIDTVDILTAELKGDTLFGAYSKGRLAKYVRR